MQKLGTRFADRLNRSAFFFGAVLFHLVLFLMLVGYVVWQPAPPEQPEGFTFIPPAQVQPPATPPTPPVTPPGPPKAGSSLDVISLHDDASGGQPTPFSSKVFDVNPGSDLGGAPGHAPKPPPISDPNYNPKAWVDINRIKEIAQGREVHGNPDFLKFPIYLAKYSDGDWDCNSYFHDGQLTSGCLPNLMAKIHDWSHGELDGREVKVVALDSPDILTEPPPFIFFTGHKDFHLTDAEVINLRKYLQIGGALWGDSAYAGDGSRFDVAFQREMKRVLPDQDLQFVPVPADHDIFTSKSKFTLNDTPAGMNRRADPIQCINLDGKLAVLYTPNDYSDMMTMLLQPGENEREAQMDGWNHWEPQHPLFTPGQFVWHAAFFRNYAPASAMTSYKLSMNILIYLLHRYDDEIEMNP